MKGHSGRDAHAASKWLIAKGKRTRAVEGLVGTPLTQWPDFSRTVAQADVCLLAQSSGKRTCHAGGILAGTLAWIESRGDD